MKSVRRPRRLSRSRRKSHPRGERGSLEPRQSGHDPLPRLTIGGPRPGRVVSELVKHRESGDVDERDYADAVRWIFRAAGAGVGVASGPRPLQARVLQASDDGVRHKSDVSEQELKACRAAGPIRSLIELGVGLMPRRMARLPSSFRSRFLKMGHGSASPPKRRSTCSTSAQAPASSSMPSESRVLPASASRGMGAGPLWRGRLLRVSWLSPSC